MKSVAIYNMKGGVGKTTTAVNLSYLAAGTGQRTLLWDLDPQAASSFAFRVRPRVSGFDKTSLEDGRTLGAAIKETDYNNLFLLPADFGYRKFERFLGSLGKPERLVTFLLGKLGRDFDAVFLDCPAGFSLLTEGIFAAADTILVPTIPTVLSLRSVARLVKWADRTDSRSRLAAFFSMVDRRKALHRQASEWSAAYPEVFLSGQIPYASVVEQMAVRRMPLAAFAPRDAATTAFENLWTELQMRLHQDSREITEQRDRWVRVLQAVESLIARLEPADQHSCAASCQGPAVDGEDSTCTPRELADDVFVHNFDTERRDLERCGYVLQLRERKGRHLVVAARSDSDRASDTTRRAEAQVDSSWALQILSGAMSPLAALERRLGRLAPRTVEDIRVIVAGRTLRRIDSRLANRSGMGLKANTQALRLA